MRKGEGGCPTRSESGVFLLIFSSSSSSSHRMSSDDRPCIISGPERKRKEGKAEGGSSGGNRGHAGQKRCCRRCSQLRARASELKARRRVYTPIIPYHASTPCAPRKQRISSATRVQRTPTPTSTSSKRPVQKPFGGLLGPLAGLSRLSWAPLSRLGASLGRVRNLFGILKRCRGPLGPSSAVPGPSWGPHGAALGLLGGLLGGLGAVWGALWAVADAVAARRSYMLKLYAFP